MSKRTNGKTQKRTADAAAILHLRYFAGKGDKLALLEEERVNAAIARQICSLREKAGLSQRELARMVGTTASVICRLEDADYEGHSLAMFAALPEHSTSEWKSASFHRVRGFTQLCSFLGLADNLAESLTGVRIERARTGQLDN